MPAHGTWLEAALNGPWTRALQPGVPVAVREIVEQGIACAREGAGIIHVHAYDEGSGRQRDDGELYRRIIEGIREQEDVIVYPTLPLAGSPDAPAAMGAAERFRLGAALHRQVPRAPLPMFSDGFAFGFPPREYALETYRTLLLEEAPARPWMVAGLAVDIRPLIQAATALGGHVRVGLEDAPFGHVWSNVIWTRTAASSIENSGGRVAPANEIRRALQGIGVAGLDQ